MSRPLADVEYRAMAYSTCEVLCLKNLLTEFSFKPKSPMSMYYDNQSAIYISKSSVSWLHHIKICCHLAQDVVKKQICTTFTP